MTLETEPGSRLTCHVHIGQGAYYRLCFAYCAWLVVFEKVLMIKFAVWFCLRAVDLARCLAFEKRALVHKTHRSVSTTFHVIA